MGSKRANNFSSQEVEKLLELVDKYKIIIGNKKTDRVSTDVKNEKWKILEKEFNASIKQNTRTANHLRTKYENMKRKAKRNLNAVNLGICEANISQADEKILSICSTSSDLNFSKLLDDSEPLIDVDISENLRKNTKAYRDDYATSDNTENDKESSTKLEAPSSNDYFAAVNTGDETENDTTLSFQHILKKSMGNNPLRRSKKRSSNIALISKKEKWTKNPWSMIAEKEINKIEEEMIQQQERHKLEVKKMKQEIEQMRELHQLQVQKIHQDLEHQKEVHQLEIKKMSQESGHKT